MSFLIIKHEEENNQFSHFFLTLIPFRKKLTIIFISSENFFIFMNFLKNVYNKYKTYKSNFLFINVKELILIVIKFILSTIESLCKKVIAYKTSFIKQLKVCLEVNRNK